MTDEASARHDATEGGATPEAQGGPGALGEDGGARDDQAELRRRRAMARSVIVAFAGASAAATAIPLPVRDAVMLSPIEMAEINALAEIYGIPQEESVREVMATLVELGALSVVARHAAGAIGARQRVRLGAAARSAAVAAAIVAGVGVATAYAFDQVHQGRLSMDELGVARRLRSSGALQGLSERMAASLDGVLGEDATEGLRTAARELLRALVPTA